MTKAELIDPMLITCSWGITEGSKIPRKFGITAEKTPEAEVKEKWLVYKGAKLAEIEVKN